MNQGKLEVVKQEMARVKGDSLGSRELKWTEIVSLTQMTIYNNWVLENSLIKTNSFLSYNTS